MRKNLNFNQSKREVDLFHNGACLVESLPSNGRVRQQIQGWAGWVKNFSHTKPEPLLACMHGQALSTQPSQAWGKISKKS